MKNIRFSIMIHASAERVWQVLWNKETYKQWTRPFHEGSYMEGEIIKGETVRFLTPEQDGMTSLVEELEPNRYIAFRHIGVISKGKEQPPDGENQKWLETTETYQLIPEDEGVTLLATVMIDREAEEMMNQAFPEALEEVKRMAEQ